jgi:hypothetical protein
VKKSKSTRTRINPLSSLEEEFYITVRAVNLPAAVREYKFHPKRNWRFDFAWPQWKVAAELQGGLGMGGRHTRGASLVLEYDKLNEAQVLGWKVFLFAWAHIENLDILRLLEAVLRTAPLHTAEYEKPTVENQAALVPK